MNTRKSRQQSAPHVRFYALGGLGEVGMNCAVIETEGRLLIIDCGVTFPESMHYGIDVIVPDFAALLARRNDIEALVITHGHMDHIGAIPWLLKEINVPIHAPAFAAELIRRSLKEHDLLDRAEIHVFDEDSRLKLGPFDLEFPAVNHSVPHAHAIVLRTSVGVFVHTGDFKVDHRPVGEEAFDLARFVDIGNEGVRALFADSTNAEVPGFSGSERDAAQGLRQVIRDIRGRVFVALFSSNVFRVQSLFTIAAETGRKVVYLGRSVHTTIEAALRVGSLTIPPSVQVLDLDEVNGQLDEELMFICTGTQAEPRAALTRLANDDYPRLRFKPSDTVVFSARIIPGNETWVYQVFDELARRDITVITPNQAKIHVSGHGYREDLRLMHRALEPDVIVPVHGDHRYQKAHAALARESGIRRSHVLNNGDILEFREKDSSVVGTIETGRRLVDGTIFDDMDGETFRERRQIARGGVVFVALTGGAADGRLLADPAITQVGAFVPDDVAGTGMMQELKGVIRSAWKRLDADARKDANEAAEQVRRSVRRHLRENLGRSPLVVVRAQLV